MIDKATRGFTKEDLTGLDINKIFNTSNNQQHIRPNKVTNNFDKPLPAEQNNTNFDLASFIDIFENYGVSDDFLANQFEEFSLKRSIADDGGVSPAPIEAESKKREFRKLTDKDDRVQYNNLEGVELHGAAGHDDLRISQSRDYGIYGDDGSDVIVVSDQLKSDKDKLQTEPNVINGGGGNDWLFSYDIENLWMYGGNGNDYSNIVIGKDIGASLGAGDDHFYMGHVSNIKEFNPDGTYERSNKEFFLGAGNDTGQAFYSEGIRMFAGQGNDKLIMRGVSHSVIDGNEGNDTFEILSMQDTLLRGGTGQNNYIVFNDGPGPIKSSTIDGSLGDDTVDITPYVNQDGTIKSDYTLKITNEKSNGTFTATILNKADQSTLLKMQDIERLNAKINGDIIPIYPKIKLQPQ